MPKNLLVTGAASGTGLGIARRFAREGYAAFIAGRDAKEAEAAAEKLAAETGAPSRGLVLDSLDGEEGIERAMAGLPPLDTLVLNAASAGPGMNPLTVDLAAWREVIETNVVWNFAIARAAARGMKERGGGSIVFIGSNTGRRAIMERSAYIASKGAISAMTRALAVDLAAHDIRVNSVLPGVISTPRWEKRDEKDKQTRYELIPLAKAATFDEVADAVYYLAHATQCTGTELVIDGGAEIKLW